MLGSNSEQRRLFGDKALAAANVVAGALIFGQALSEKPFSTLVAAVGVVLFIAFAVVGFWLTKENT